MSSDQYTDEPVWLQSFDVTITVLEPAEGSRCGCVDMQLRLLAYQWLTQNTVNVERAGEEMVDGSVGEARIRARMCFRLRCFNSQTLACL